jgi:hypothetical protein
LEDWYFSYRSDNFLKVFFDPGLINLTAKVYIGRQAQKFLVGYVISNIESFNNK